VYFICNGSSGSGMVIGSGANPVTMDDYCLQTQIVANINFGAHNYAVYLTGSTCKLEITRSFTDTSGSPRSVNEVALYTLDPGNNLHMMERTLYSATILAFASVTVTYRIYVTV
jgi:hypothetical protein